MHIVSSPRASGTVRDRTNHAPVSGAQVAISRTWQARWPDYGGPTFEEALTDLRPPTVITGSNGQFYIPQQKKWIMEFPPPEGPARGTLVVQCDGYKAALVPVMDGMWEDLGNVWLTPLWSRPVPP